MKKENFFKGWNLSVSTIPERSLIPQLNPLHVGTAFIESLPSYIERLADILHVKTTSVIRNLILQLQMQDRTGTFLSNQINFYEPDVAGLLDRTRYKTNLVCAALEIVNGQHDVLDLTIETSGHSEYVEIKKSKAWCPYCFRSWKIKHEIIYEPLLWFFKMVRVCEIHNRHLDDTCPKCNELVYFADKCTPGYCCQCGAWLGDIQIPNRTRRHYFSKDDAISNSRYAARIIISSKQERDKMFLKEVLYKYFDRCYRFNFYRFAQDMGWSRRTFKKFADRLMSTDFENIAEMTSLFERGCRRPQKYKHLIKLSYDRSRIIFN